MSQSTKLTNEAEKDLALKAYQQFNAKDYDICLQVGYLHCLKNKFFLFL